MPFIGTSTYCNAIRAVSFGAFSSSTDMITPSNWQHDHEHVIELTDEILRYNSRKYPYCQHTDYPLARTLWIQLHHDLELS